MTSSRTPGIYRPSRLRQLISGALKNPSVWYVICTWKRLKWEIYGLMHSMSQKLSSKGIWFFEVLSLSTTSNSSGKTFCLSIQWWNKRCLYLQQMVLLKQLSNIWTCFSFKRAHSIENIRCLTLTGGRNHSGVLLGLQTFSRVKDFLLWYLRYMRHIHLEIEHDAGRRDIAVQDICNLNVVYAASFSWLCYSRITWISNSWKEHESWLLCSRHCSKGLK